MFVTKRAIPRRAFLRGTGVLAALPLLDAMVPALTAMRQTAANPAIRLGFWNTANGVFGPDFKPDGEGTNLLAGHGLTLSRILAPMESLRDQMVVATGLSNVAAESKQCGQRGPCAGGGGVPERHAGQADGGGRHRAGHRRSISMRRRSSGRTRNCCPSSLRSSPASRATAIRVTAAST